MRHFWYRRYTFGRPSKSWFFSSVHPPGTLAYVPKSSEDRAINFGEELSTEQWLFSDNNSFAGGARVPLRRHEGEQVQPPVQYIRKYLVE